MKEASGAGTSAHGVLSASLVSCWVAQWPHSPSHLAARCSAAPPVSRSRLTSLSLEPSWPWDCVGWENVLEVALCQAVLSRRLLRCCPPLSPSWDWLSPQVNKPERNCWEMRDPGGVSPAQVTVDLTSLTVWCRHTCEPSRAQSPELPAEFSVTVLS